MRERSAFPAAVAAALWVGTATGFSAAPALADPLPRAGTPAGAVIARKAGEEARFIEVADWRTVDIRQDLLPGDALRTNASGNLAILFSDRTQVRLGRNSTLVVRKVGGNGADTELSLESGQLWGRAGRGGDSVAIATPAATAAIRGTDWSLSVGGGGDTTLAVFEGRVELANAQGSVTAAQGEGARASIGQAPTKYILVNLDEREQMLLYSDRRTGFDKLSVSGLSGAQARRERDRLSATTEAGRTPEESVALAELLLGLNGRAAARSALAPLRRPLASRALEARALLVEGMIAGGEGRYAEAEKLLARAGPDLPANRQGSAAYGRWLAAGLADPARATAPLADAFAGDPVVALATAMEADSSVEKLPALEVAERRFPNDARFPAQAAMAAIEGDRRDAAAAALARARAIDSDDPDYLLADARYRTAFLGDLDGARADLLRAVEVAPGSDAAWNELGSVEADRNAFREADRAYRQAVALDPRNVAIRANYARFLVEREQLAAAKVELDQAESIDPGSYAVLAAKGRYLLRLGRVEEGQAALLQATAVNPTYGDALIGQAIAAYQRGEVEEAQQALDNADRFEHAGYAAPLIRSGIAIDEYRADDAVKGAREALARRQARGGSYSDLDANRATASYLGAALDFLELDEWGSFYRDRAFDPFLGSSFIDEAADGRVSPFAGTPALQAPDERTVEGSTGQASLLQATLRDPFSIASATRRNSLDSQAFHEVTIGGGIVLENGVPGWRTDLTAQGQGYAPLPYAYSIQADVARPDGPRDNDTQDITGGVFTLGLKPTLADNIGLHGASTDADSGFPGQAQSPNGETSEDLFSNLGIGWSHTFGEGNVLQAFVTASRRRGEQELENVVAPFDPPSGPDECYLGDPGSDFGCFGPYRLDASDRSRGVTAGIGHLLGFGPVTLRYGAEANWERGTSEQVYTAIDGFETTYGSIGEDRSRAARLYGDALWRATPDLSIEAGLWATRFERDPAALAEIFDGEASFALDPSTVDDYDGETRLDGRVGAAWSPVADHYLRAYYREDTQFATNDTLAPVSTVGLTPLDLPLVLGGETHTLGLRWDAEWNERFFTSIGYQHIDVTGLAVDTPGFLTSSFTTSTGSIDRVEMAANWWVGGGFGASATLALNDSRDEDYLEPFNDGGFVVEDGLPLIPDHLGRIGITYVSPYLFKATVAQTFVGRRVGGPYGITIDPYTTTDASLTVLSADRHLEFEFQALNIFDEDFDLALDVPGPGRTFSAVLRARF